MDWAIVEVMGHRVYAGQIEEATLAGAPVLRVHVPEVVRERTDVDWQISDRRRVEREVRTRYPAYVVDLGGGALFAVTRCTEDAARKVLSSRTNWSHAEVERTESEWRVVEPPLLEDAEEVSRCTAPGCTRQAESELTLCEAHWDQAMEAADDAGGAR